MTKPPPGGLPILTRRPAKPKKWEQQTIGLFYSRSFFDSSLQLTPEFSFTVAEVEADNIFPVKSFSYGQSSKMMKTTR